MKKDIFEKLTDSVKSTYKEVAGQAKVSADQTRVRTEVATLKAELKKLYIQLGQCYFVSTYEGYGDAEEICMDKIMEEIKETIDLINELEQDIASCVDIQKDSFVQYKDDLKSLWNEEEGEVFVGKSQNIKHIKLYKVCGECGESNMPANTKCKNCGTNIE